MSIRIGTRINRFVMERPKISTQVARAVLSAMRLMGIGRYVRAALFTQNMVPRKVPGFAVALSFSGGLRWDADKVRFENIMGRVGRGEGDFDQVSRDDLNEATLRAQVNPEIFRGCESAAYTARKQGDNRPFLEVVNDHLKATGQTALAERLFKVT